MKAEIPGFLTVPVSLLNSKKITKNHQKIGAQQRVAIIFGEVSVFLPNFRRSYPAILEEL